MKNLFRFPTLNAKRRRLSLLGASIGIALLPLAWRGTSCGHDFDFHLESWMEVVRQWHQGVLYPHWAASANYGAGEPRFVFYPPASWLLGALLGAVLPWTLVPLVFTLVVLTAMGASFFRMAREWMPEDNAALAACLYVVNPYVLFVAYERTAYGELLAAAWMPLLVLFALREQQSALKLALVIAGLWLTNAPGAVMGCYALAVMVAWAAIADRRSNLIGRAVGGLALGLGLAAFYLLPAIYEQRWVEIKRAIGEGMRVEDSFLFEHTGEVFHDQVLRTASSIAVVLLATTALAAALAWRARKGRPVRDSLWGPIVALGAVIACLLLPFSDAVWHLAPELRFLQFPWRWLLVLSLILAALAGLALRGREVTWRNIPLRAVGVLTIAFLLSGLAWQSFWQPCDDEDNVRAQVESFRSTGFEGTDEYTANPADNGDIQRGLPPVRVERTPDGDEADSSVEENPEWKAASADSQPSQARIERWDVERMTATVKSDGAAFAVLRVMDYLAWQVRVNGKTVATRPRRDDGLLTVPLGAGISKIEVRYGTTRDMSLGRIVSLIAVVLWVVLAAFTGRKKVS